MIVRGLATLGLSIVLALVAISPVKAGEPDISDAERRASNRALVAEPGEEVLVDIVYARTWVANGSLFVAGELRNTSGHRLDGWAQVGVTPGHYTSGATVLATVASQALARGSRLAFFGKQSPFAPKSVTMTWSNAGGWLVDDPVDAIGVSYVGGLYSDPGTGDSARYQIRNTTDRSIWVWPAAIFRGSDGKVTNMAIGSTVNLLPGEIVEDWLLAPPTGRPAVRVSMDIRAAGFTEAPYAPLVSWLNWFEDVDGQSLKGAIAWLAEQGITSGCARYRFCPTARVTRAQMAMFLVRAFDLPPATGGDHFVDDDGVTGESSINALFEAGITGGCAAGRFCPTANVTRAQMALFIDRVMQPPLAPTSTDYFDDDDGRTGEAAINRLAAAGITGGCGPRRFCPSDPVTRAQMAAFLQRALTYAP